MKIPKEVRHAIIKCAYHERQSQKYAEIISDYLKDNDIDNYSPVWDSCIDNVFQNGSNPYQFIRDLQAEVQE